MTQFFGKIEIFVIVCSDLGHLLRVIIIYHNLILGCLPSGFFKGHTQYNTVIKRRNEKSNFDAHV